MDILMAFTKLLLSINLIIIIILSTRKIIKKICYNLKLKYIYIIIFIISIINCHLYNKFFNKVATKDKSLYFKI